MRIANYQRRTIPPFPDRDSLFPANIKSHEMYERNRNRPEQSSRPLKSRRNPHSWFAFRLFLGFLGAALVLLPLALPQSWIASIFGLVLFLTSILLPPAPEAEPAAEASRTSAQQLVLTGAEFSAADANPIPVKLFVSEQQVLAMKPDLQPATVVPFVDLQSVFLQRSEDSWLLILESVTGETVFTFHGVFAERNSRKAESVIRRFLPALPPEKPKARAARA
ncbi:MAG: hypothetical protein NVS9B14_02450 [Candidatus Acidiferrum sp.]